MRNVLVTGGSRGLGLGIGRTLAAAGFRVVAVARQEGPQLAAARAQAPEGALQFRSFDLADLDGIAGLVKSLRREFGAFYGLVNNAGIGTAGILANMPDNSIERLVRLNLVSPLTLTKYLIRSMMSGQGEAGQEGDTGQEGEPAAAPGGRQESGRIVNIASVVASTGYSGLSVYSATKASLIGFTRSLAREVGPLGITVNAVAPGFVDTDMTHQLTPEQRGRIARRSALHRMPQVEDVAHAVEFLFSERARNITGTVLTVDAGNTA